SASPPGGPCRHGGCRSRGGRSSFLAPLRLGAACHPFWHELCNRGCTTDVDSSRMGSERISWVLLAYRLPREPSTPRSALWRKLRRLGVAQVLDGLAALPLDARNRERLEWLADEIAEAGGEATIWVGELGSAGQERELAARMADAIAVEYRALIEHAAMARRQASGQQRRTVARLRRESRPIRARDHFP